MSNAIRNCTLAASALAGLAAWTVVAAMPLGQPALSALVAPRAPDLVAAGVQRIDARAGQRATSIRVLTTSGPIYFGWPSRVEPAPFTVEDSGRGYGVSADVAPGEEVRLAAAIEGVLPEVVRRAKEHQAQVNRPRK